jgi:hypothetical protein
VQQSPVQQSPVQTDPKQAISDAKTGVGAANGGPLGPPPPPPGSASPAAPAAPAPTDMSFPVETGADPSAGSATGGGPVQMPMDMKLPDGSDPTDPKGGADAGCGMEGCGGMDDAAKGAKEGKGKDSKDTGGGNVHQNDPTQGGKGHDPSQHGHKKHHKPKKHHAHHPPRPPHPPKPPSGPPQQSPAQHTHKPKKKHHK